MLKLYVYGYLNRIQSTRRLEGKARRNVELMWLLGRLAPDFKTISDFRKDNTKAIRLVCRDFVMIYRKPLRMPKVWKITGNHIITC
jgi:transposase